MTPDDSPAPAKSAHPPTLRRHASRPRSSTPRLSPPKEPTRLDANAHDDFTASPSLKKPSSSTDVPIRSVATVGQNSSFITGQESSHPQKRRVSKRSFLGSNHPNSERAFKSIRSSVEETTDNHEKQNTAVPSVQLVETTPHQVNLLKSKNAELEEALSRTRDTLLATIDNQNRQIQELEKQVSQQLMQITSLREPRLECSCTNKTSLSRKEGKIDVLDTKFQPVARNVMRSLRYEATDIVREVVAVDSGLIRDWTGKVEILSNESAEEGQHILNLGDKKAVPKCPMEQALCGSIFTPPSKISIILEDIVRSEIEEVSEETFNEQEREECISAIVRHKPISSWFGRVLSETASLKKLNLRCKYFELLGYNHIRKAAKDKNESDSSKDARLEEQKHARDNLFMLNPNRIPIFSRWRLLHDEDIKFGNIAEECERVPSNDIFFKSYAAKQAFDRFLDADTEDGENESSILMLARADAWITVSLEMFEEKETRGGRRNSRFRALFKQYVPLALEAILETCRKKVAERYEEEVKSVRMGMDTTAQFGNDQRNATIVFKMPSSGMLYLAVRSTYFSNEISNMLGNVKDCYIGRALPTSINFQGIVAVDSDCHELSDVDDTEHTSSEQLDQSNNE